MKKKILAVMLCVCSLILCGCSSSVEYSVYQDGTNAVYEVNYIPFSMTELRNLLGTEKEDVILDIQGKITGSVYSYYLEQRNSFIKKVNEDKTLTPEQKIILKSQYNEGVQDFSTIIATGDARIPVAGVQRTSDYIKIALKYSSPICYYIAKANAQEYKGYKNLLEELKKDERIIQKGFFINQKVNKGGTLFGDMYDENRTFATYILDECVGVLKTSTTLTDKQIKAIVPKSFVFRYGTTNTRLRSNADYKHTDGPVHFHEWNLNTEFNNEGKPFVAKKEAITWTNHANRNVWYLIVLGASFVLIGVLFAYDKIKKNKDKNNTKNDDVNNLNKDENVINIK